MNGGRPVRAAASLCVLGIFLLTATVLLAGCNAPHDNPLDPAYDGDRQPSKTTLDHATQFLSVRIYTRHEEAADLSLDDTYLAVVEARVLDEDGVAGVNVEIADSLLFPMTYNASSAKYTFTLNPNRYYYSIFDFVGSPFFVDVYDELGFVRRSEKEMIVRVLDETPVIVSPRDQSGNPAITGPTPTMIWQQYRSPFPITYRVTISKVTNGEVVMQRSNIQRVLGQEGAVDSLRLTSALSSNILYSWNVAAIDDKGNESKSKPAFFRVE